MSGRYSLSNRWRLVLNLVCPSFALDALDPTERAEPQPPPFFPPSPPQNGWRSGSILLSPRLALFAPCPPRDAHAEAVHATAQPGPGCDSVPSERRQATAAKTRQFG